MSFETNGGLFGFLFSSGLIIQTIIMIIDAIINHIIYPTLGAYISEIRNNYIYESSFIKINIGELMISIFKIISLIIITFSTISFLKTNFKCPN